MNQSAEVKDSVYEDFKEELRRNGYFHCSNKSLSERLYHDLKPEFPTLYRQDGKDFQKLTVVQKSDENIAFLEEKKQELLDKIQEIDIVLKAVHSPDL